MSRTVTFHRIVEKAQAGPADPRSPSKPALHPAKQRLGFEAKLWLLLSGMAMIAAILWSYWPTLREMVHKWESQPDYSHGFLVLPIAIYFLWQRRDRFPATDIGPSWWGAILILIAVASRFAAGLYYLVPLDGWTLPLTVAGTTWLLFGRAVLWWTLPSVAFLWFMLPIPFSAERMLSVPLQALATKLSTAALVFLGQPAVAEGNVILLGDERLLVEESCSGMRIFVGIFALGFAFILFSRTSWWLKAILLLAALPVAIFTNVVRIVGTGLLYQWVSSHAGQKFSHDIAGFIMIPMAAAVFWLVVIYFDKLFPQVEDIDQTSERYRPCIVPNG
jgi:exosortase